jgi:homoserine/homoserine lactone efflux protein
MDIATFILISFVFIAIPGPNVLIVVSTGISHGTMRGLQTIGGISLAMAIQLFIAAIGTTWFVAALSHGFAWLKWGGVFYLLYLGLNHLVSAVSAERPQNQASVFGAFQRGFWISLTNPKTILFFSAFLPQFTLQSSSYFAQIASLSFIFWVIAGTVNCCYVLLASNLTSLLRSKDISRYQHVTSGLLYLGAGVALAVSKDGK